MPKAIVFVLLALAVAAFGGGPPATDLSYISPPTVRRIDALCYGRDGVVAQEAMPGGQYVYAVCGNTLRRVDRGDIAYTGNATGRPGVSAAVPRVPVWKQASAYTLEFAAAGAGALLAEACGIAALEGVYQAGWNGPGSVPGAVAFCLTSTVLSAGGTHLVGRLFGCGNTFNRALAGGAIGGLLGGAAFVDYFVTRKNPHTVMLPIGLVLPPLCTVIVYNLWRDDGTK